ncbi:MAG: outer membrane beta-barrel protein [Leptospiraceae bacterium]|nr:outer membrane beta-barrel protein [Leptospiraceae bacterium]MCZ8347119.1 outer membrane beta-barrel protein [Leptospiraceae bacterium]
MRKTNLFFATFTLFTLFSTSVFSQGKSVEKKESEKLWYEKVDVSGFVDVYYNYTSNNRTGATQDASGTFHTYNKQFAVNAVKLSLGKVAEKDSPWGFKMDLQNGQNLMYQERPYQTTNSLHNMQLLQQAYVSAYFPVLKGLTVDAGKMATHIGLEVLDSKDNISYTIGYVFFNTIPFIHTGARAALQWSDNLTTSLYLYNSAQGTGYTGNGQQFGYSGLSAYGDPAGGSSLTNTSQHAYADGPNPARTFGSQVKYAMLDDKLTVVWNTLVSNDNAQGRPTNQTFYLSNRAGVSNVPQASRFSTDNWMIQNLILIYQPTDKLTTIFDYTYGERNGQTNTAAFGYEPGGLTLGKISSNLPNVTVPNASTDPTLQSLGITADTNLTRENRIKRIYQTFQIQAKYAFTEFFTLGFRYEYLDDRRYGGSLAVNPPLFALTPNQRYDLRLQDNLGVRAASNYGQIRTITLTPTFNLTENLQVKVDLRRDFGPGQQFVDQAGRPASHQNGIIIGMVAKF